MKGYASPYKCPVCKNRLRYTKLGISEGRTWCETCRHMYNLEDLKRNI